MKGKVKIKKPVCRKPPTKLDRHLIDFDQLPPDLSFLVQPPSTSGISLPSTPKLQTLPFTDMSWENFQRLCCRIALQDKNIEFCELYGKQGSKQAGIDLYARKTGLQKYTVYQCKNESKFGPQKIRNAIEEFRQGKWAEKTEEFHLCTRENLHDFPKRVDTIEKERTKLEEDGIKLIIWHGSTLIDSLKSRPDLVEDFFSAEIADAFCLSPRSKHRLTAEHFYSLRGSLRSLYEAKFKNDDVIFSLSDDNLSNADILERFVEPQIVPGNLRLLARAKPKSTTNRITDAQRESNTTSTESTEKTKTTVETERTITTLPVRLSQWLQGGKRFLIFGEAGSGKSSLLRFLALELLQDVPSTSIISENWSGLLPIWVPFRLWTTKLSESSGEHPSIKEIVARWLKSLDADDLLPLLNGAIEQDKVVILVDGIDEWTDENAARAALSKLAIFSERTNVPTIATTRPRAYTSNPFNQSNWIIGKLADLEPDQIQEFCSKAFLNYPSKGSKAVKKRDPKKLFNKIMISSDLRRLAKNPLLLRFLIYFYLKDVPLPSDKYGAYKDILDHLLSERPISRRESALIIGSNKELESDKVREAFRRLAFYAQSSIDGSIIVHKEVSAQLSNYFDPAWSDDKVANFINVACKEIGIFSSISDGYYFIHRTFQEFLAAEYLIHHEDNLWPQIENHLYEANWHQVILCAYYLSDKQMIRDAFVTTLHETTSNDILKSLSLEIYSSAFLNSQYRFTSAQTLEMFERLIPAIEKDGLTTHQNELLENIIDSAEASPISQKIIDRFKKWFPKRKDWIGGLLSAMKTWSADDIVTNTLLSSLHKFHPAELREAVSVLIHHGEGLPDLAESLVNSMDSCNSQYVYAALLEGLIQEFPDYCIEHDIIRFHSSSSCSEIRLAALKGELILGGKKDEYFDLIIKHASDRSRLHYSWKELIEELLQTYWGGSQELKKLCLSSLQQRFEYGLSDHLEYDMAWQLLLTGYPGDTEVAQAITAEIQTQEYPFLSLRHSAWAMIKSNFKDHADIVKATDEWIVKQQFHEPEISEAALVGRTDIAKKKLLASLKESSVPHWAMRALLDGWPKNDQEIKAAIAEVLNAGIDRVSRIASFLPQIIRNEKDCKKLLLEILSDNACHRHDSTLLGISHFNDPSLSKKAITIALKLKPPMGGRYSDDSLRYTLIWKFSDDSRIRDMAIKEIRKQDAQFEAIARSCDRDPILKSEILSLFEYLRDDLRVTIARCGASGSFNRKHTQDIFGIYDFESTSDIKTSASIAFHESLEKGTPRFHKEVATLTDNITVIGSDYEERRQAAFCGLISARRLNIFKKIREKYGRDSLINIQLGSKGDDFNIALVASILKNWEYINESLGESFYERFHSGENTQDHVFQTLTVIAQYYKEPSKCLLEYFQSQKPKIVASQVLHFLAHLRPKSSVLHDYCIATIFDRQGNWSDANFRDRLTASFLLGKHFAGDSTVLKLLIDRSTFENQSEVMLALCEGWPDSEELLSRYKNLDKIYNLSESVKRQIHLHFKSADLIPDFLSELLVECKRTAQYLDNLTKRELAKRVKADPTLANRLFQLLHTTSEPCLRASLPKLLSIVQASSEELESWCRDALKAQDAGVMAFDAIDGHYKPLRVSLLEAVYRFQEIDELE